MKITIATRRSELALVQTRWVAGQLKAQDENTEVAEHPVVTQGDKILDRPLMAVGGKGLFVSEVEQCLADGSADLAVHSYKDVPAELLDGMDVLCVPERHDARDALITPGGVDLDDLPAGASVGTSSLRRTAQLRARRPDLRFKSLRGNVPTRLGRLESGDFDAIVLAEAGLRRLGLDPPRKVLSPEWCIPAVGQGALAIEGVASRSDLRERLSAFEHVPTRIAVTIERAFLGALEGNCKSPIAGYARFSEDGSLVQFDGMVASLDGDQRLCGSRSESLRRPFALSLGDAAQLGRDVAQALIEAGARKLIIDAVAAADRLQGLN